MNVEQQSWSDSDGWQQPAALADAHLVLVFGERAALSAATFAASLAARWPTAMRIGCSTAGQIHGTEVFDDGAIATAVRFDHTTVRVATAPVTASASASTGARLAAQLAGPDLVHIIVLSEGLDINGEALVRGLGEGLDAAVWLYKRYLGDHAADLPASGLLFPLSLRTREGSAPVVRTILSVSEAEQSLTFAGDVPVGGYVRLMKANFDRLIDGAVGASRVSTEALGTPVDLALLVSCVGRRMVLRQRVEEEVEGVRDIVGAAAAITGFYSYGEISPFTPQARCELHNQTMTVTTFSER